MPNVKSEFAAPQLPPWLSPLSAIGLVVRLLRKPEQWELTLLLSEGATIALVLPDNTVAGSQLARGLVQAGKILARSPAAAVRQSELRFDDDEG